MEWKKWQRILLQRNTDFGGKFFMIVGHALFGSLLGFLGIWAHQPPVYVAGLFLLCAEILVVLNIARRTGEIARLWNYLFWGFVGNVVLFVFYFGGVLYRWYLLLPKQSP